MVPDSFPCYTQRGAVRRVKTATMLLRSRFRTLLFLPLLFVLAARGPASAADSNAPLLFNRLNTDCLGSLISDVTLGTASPNLQITLQDTGSGLRFGQSAHTGGANARTGTKLLMHFDEAALTYTDDTTFAHNAVAANNPTPPASCAGAGFTGAGDCIDFTAAGQFIRVLKSANLADTTSQITIQAWINPDSLGSDPIVEFNDPAGGTPIGLHFWHSVSASGDLYANLISSGRVNNVIKSSGGFVRTGVWQLATLTFGGGAAKLYLNDVMIASGGVSGVGGFDAELLDVNKDVYIGHRPSVGGTTFDGQIDEVRILRGGLSDKDIAADYYSGIVEISTSGSSGPRVKTRIPAGAVAYSGSATNGTVSAVTATYTAAPFVPGNQNFVSWLFQDMSGNTSFSNVTLDIFELPPTAPTLFAGSPSGTTSIAWSWTAPSRYCLSAGGGGAIYQVLNAATNADVSAGDPTKTDLAFSETGGLAANTAYGRVVRAVDAFGNGALSGSATTYTQAAIPTTLSLSAVSTGSVVIGWSAAGNPGYTRYEVSLSSDNFTTVFSTPAQISDNLVAVSLGVGGLLPNTTYNVRVRAKNGQASDALGQTFTGFLTGSFATLAAAPTSLSASALGVSSIAWSWSAVPTATSYRLENANTGAAIVVTGGTSFNQTGVAANSQIVGKLRADNASGNGLFGADVGVYTHANVPTGPPSVTAGSTTLAISWGLNSNPANTVFQAVVSTSAEFGVIAQTVSVSGTSANFTNLVPATVYHVKVRSVNGDGIVSAFTAATQTQTTQFVGISSASAPSTPYSPTSGSVGVWHFDESSGTLSTDASGNANQAQLTCGFVNCSTPTFTSGMSGLGNAVRFSGIQNTLCRVGSKANLETTGDITVSAWVYPDSFNQVGGAGIVVKGSGSFESYALETTPTREWSFKIVDSANAQHSIKSTMTLATGKWTHLTGVYVSGAGALLRLYVDGVQTSSAALVGGGIAARRADTHDLTIGNRQSGSASYDRGFNGSIDEAQIQTRALSAAEILGLYQSASPGTFTAPSPNENTRLTIPADAFGNQATILVSGTPLTSPIKINTGILTDGLAAPPTGQTYVPDSVIEIVANVNGSAFTENLHSSVTVSIPYPDSDGNLLVDGTDPPLPVTRLTMYTLNEAVVRWEPLATTVDTANKRVNGQTSHFSVFALFGPTGVKSDVNTVRVYPNPWKPGSSGNFDSVTFGSRTGLAIDNLPTSGVIRIFTLSGERVVDVPFSGPDAGTAIWDGRNQGGLPVASGVYFAYVKSDTGATVVKKFAIQR